MMLEQRLAYTELGCEEERTLRMHLLPCTTLYDFCNEKVIASGGSPSDLRYGALPLNRCYY